ncbi:hypothetical protein K502DRAFT_364901 [Neoconidiobolus thromboides FSU 785]|nr:hypothetical protein K502DRAFT_364901 [Neoconidiobolus thromboides FSU 785]
MDLTPPINNNTVSEQNEIEIASDYAIKNGLNHVIYRVMIYGNKQQKTLLRLISIILYHNDSFTFYSYLLPLSIFCLFTLLIQGWYLIHCLRSIKNQANYVKFNRRTMIKFQLQEANEREQQLTAGVISYEFIAPPNYREANTLPPAYIQG